jgi:protein-L-isoaspartate(D-aspartate) O-methyltransferase
MPCRSAATEDSQRLVQAARASGVRDDRLLTAIADVPRARFVPPEAVGVAYADRPIPIAHDQVTTQPSLVAQMIEALALAGEEKVLEIGTGYGWQTALLARLARIVWSVERWPDMAEVARANLDRQQILNVHLVVDDGSVGLPDEAPFDAILVAAAFPTVPQPLVDQLTAGGRLVQPIGPGGREDVTLFRKRPHGLVAVRQVVPAHFVRLYGQHGYPAGVSIRQRVDLPP